MSRLLLPAWVSYLPPLETEPGRLCGVDKDTEDADSEQEEVNAWLIRCADDDSSVFDIDV